MFIELIARRFISDWWNELLRSLDSQFFSSKYVILDLVKMANLVDL